MSFFENSFRRKKRIESVVLIDISADSVAGAYARYEGDAPPSLLYTRRLPVEARKDEPQEQAMLRAFAVLGDALIREGAPALARAIGAGTVDAVMVSLDYPWQRVSIRTERLEQETPFIFTRSLAEALLEKTRDTTSSESFVGEHIVGTILNGYETRAPYGKKAHRAEIIALSSIVDAPVVEQIVATLRRIYHAGRITTLAACPVRYHAIRRMFPHERNALIIDAMGRTTAITLIRNGLLTALTEASGLHDGRAYARRVGETLAELAKSYPLPRMIFLLAREPDSADLRASLDPANLGNLWLSDTPSRVVSVLPGALGAFVRQSSASSPDLMLMLMALHGWRRAPEDVT